MCRNYKCAPVPFMGQKRYFLRDFTEVLQQVEGEIDTVVDLFGGSGLLSHTAKRGLPGSFITTSTAILTGWQPLTPLTKF